MRKISVLTAIAGLVVCSASFSYRRPASWPLHYNDSLRALYERPASQWPKPFIDQGIQWHELAALPADTLNATSVDDPKIRLGKMLFFDPRLSGSNQISCSTCHDPEKAWTDGRTVSVGHNQLQ